jgi:hypothetical protein
MERQHADYQVVPYPKYRRFAAATYRSVSHKPMIHGLLELDVTKARTLLRQHKAKTGESLSFTAFLATCLAKAVDERKVVQAMRQGGKRLVVFADVDVLTRIERDVNGQEFVVPYIIRAANHKSFRQLHDEIRAAQRADVNDLQKRQLRLLSLVPIVLSGAFVWAFTALGRWHPRLWKATMGTVGITSVGMFGGGPGWGIPSAMPTPLTLTLGGIGEKQVIVDGRPVVWNI